MSVNSMFTGSNTELVTVVRVIPKREQVSRNQTYTFFAATFKSENGAINTINLSEPQHESLVLHSKVWLTRQDSDGKTFYNVDAE